MAGNGRNEDSGYPRGQREDKFREALITICLYLLAFEARIAPIQNLNLKFKNMGKQVNTMKCCTGKTFHNIKISGGDVSPLMAQVTALEVLEQYENSGVV